MDLDRIADELLACVADGLTLPACQVCATPGMPVVDWCCDCPDADPTVPGDQPGQGQLNVTLVDVFDADPDTLVRTVAHTRPCRTGVVAAQWDVTLARCVPTVDSGGRPPGCDEQAAAATQVHTDVGEVWRALACCVDVGRLAILDVEVQAPPSGGCVVIVARVLTAVDTRPEAG